MTDDELPQPEATPTHEVDRFGKMQTEVVWRMDAYYFGFDPTDVAAIDRILSAVACGGKAAHHTDDWTTAYGPWSDYLRGESVVDWIQNAAEDAAIAFRAYGQQCAAAANARAEAAEKELAALKANQADERAKCKAEFEIDKLDAQRWRRYRKNPYDATDQILKALNVDKSCHWATQADEAIDAAIQYWRAE